MWFVKTDDLNKAREIVGQGASLSAIFKEIPKDSIMTQSTFTKSSSVIDIIRRVDSGEYTTIYLNLEG